MKYELRSIAAEPVSLEGRKLYGTVIPYNSLSHDLGGFVERFMPGSVTETIKSGMIEAWAHHDPTKPIGSQAGGTLRLFEDTRGLHYEDLLPDASYARDLMALMSDGRKDIGGTSFGFHIAGSDGQRWLKENGSNVREVLRAEINHISPVVTPAYPATSTNLRSIQHEIEVAEYGIDLDALRSVLIAVKQNLKISDEDAYLCSEVISKLRTVARSPKLEKACEAAEKILL